MPVEYQATFTCDRCGATERRTMVSDADRATPPPVEWTKIMGSSIAFTFRTRSHANHNEKLLCGACSNDLYQWWQQPKNQPAEEKK